MSDEPCAIRACPGRATYERTLLDGARQALCTDCAARIVARHRRMAEINRSLDPHPINTGALL